MWVTKLFNALPELIALLKVAALGESVWEVLICAQLFRQAWIGAEVIHGVGHSLARALVDQDPTAISLANLLEHRSMMQMAQGLIPLSPMSHPPREGPPIPWLDAGDPEPWKLRLKAGGPLLLHGLVCGWAGIAFLRLQQSGAAGTWIGDLLLGLLFTNLWLVLTSHSDLETLLSGQGALLYCGNFGLIASKEHAGRGELLSPRALEIFEQMGRDTELRGAQAGGGLVMALDRRGDNGFVGHKIVNAKRGDLTPSLKAAFRTKRRRARRNGWRPHPAGLMACWHYRFGTSGPPAVRETHWQEWTPGRHAHLWRQDGDGQWRQHWRRVHHRITHNGDFEAFSGFGRLVDVGILTARQSDGIRHWNTGPEIVAIGTDPALATGPFEQVFVLPCSTGTERDEEQVDGADQLIESLRESRFVAFRRLLASYVFFWAMVRDVALLPVLRFKWWRSQSRTRVMTTAAPVSAARLDLAEEEEIAALSLDNAGREQS
jgi:hypothetical protein